MSERADRVHVLTVYGSTRTGSVNRAVLDTVAAGAADAVEVTAYRELAELPHFDPDRDPSDLTAAPAAVQRLRGALVAADAVLLSTPEYAGALPGALKNLLEWSIGAGALDGRPVAWINPSTSPRGARDAHASLRLVLAYTGARIVEEACLDVPVPRTAVEDGRVTDVDAAAAIDGALAGLVAAVRSPNGGS